MTAAAIRPVPLPVLTVMALGVCAALVVGTFPLTSWAYGDWTAVSASSREALVYAGPWAASWCAWVSGRYLGPRSMLCLPSSVRSGQPIVRAHARVLAGAVVTGYVAGLVPVLWVTGQRASSGSLDWTVVAGSVAVLLAFCAGGYLIGCALPRAASVIVAATASFTVILMVDTWGPVVAPLRLTTTSAGTYETGVVSSFRIVLFSALALALVTAAAKVVGDRTTVRTASNYTGLTIVLVPLMLAAAARATSPDAVLREDLPPASCTRVDSLPVCVHSAKAALLPALATAVDRVLAVVDRKPAVPLTGVFDAALGPQAPADSLILDLQTQDQNWESWAAADLAGYISGQQACNQRGNTSGDSAETATDQFAVSDGITAWLSKTAGYTAPQLNRSPVSDSVAATLEQQSPGEVRRLYQRFAPQIATCELSSSVLR